MTVSTQQSSQVFEGNGATNTFDFSFIGVEADDISVIFTDTDGTVTTLSPSQYTVFLNPAAIGSLWGIGGTVTYPTMGSPIDNNTTLTITRTLPLTQTTSISNQGGFGPQVIETALDILEMQIQQISGRTGQFRGTWATDVTYNFGDYVIDGANGADTLNYYMCLIANTSGVWATDLTAGDWTVVSDFPSIDTINAAVAAAEAAAATATTEAGIATTQATNAATSATNAATSATAAQNYALALSSTSATSLLIATGAKTFTTQSGKQFQTGQFLIAASNAGPTNYMHGSVTSYSGTTLILNITDIGGSGTYADWDISISGTQGPIGPSTVNIATTAPISGGPITTTGTLTFDINAATTATIATGDLLIFGDISDSNLPKKTTVSGLLALIASTNTFTSADQTLTNAGLLTLAHGLSSTPNDIQIILVCQSNDQNYTAGQLLFVMGLQHSNFGVALVANSTNLLVRQFDSGSIWGALDFTTGGTAQLDNTKWKMRFIAKVT